MCCGVPCIATDVGDCKHLIGNTGIIVPPQDSYRLSVALEELITKAQTSNWQSLKDSCRQRMQQVFSFRKMLDKYLDIWGCY